MQIRPPFNTSRSYGIVIYEVFKDFTSLHLSLVDYQAATSSRVSVIRSISTPEENASQSQRQDGLMVSVLHS